jgi:hypothetical protein
LKKVKNSLYSFFYVSRLTQFNQELCLYYGHPFVFYFFIEIKLK